MTPGQCWRAYIGELPAVAPATFARFRPQPILGPMQVQTAAGNVEPSGSDSLVTYAAIGAVAAVALYVLLKK